jgi:hypothetical protein
VKLFECGACGQPLYFEAQRCQSCRRRLGFAPATLGMVALEWQDGRWVVLGAEGERVRFCSNAEHDVCNWLIPEASRDSLCIACSHNRMIPPLSASINLARWRLLEKAKHRLFYSLLKLRLPLTKRPLASDGLSFDFLSDSNEAVADAPTILTGHDNGLITINIAEADDAERERRRGAMGEPYRTLLGHFRHEVGHYYWMVLVEREPSLLEGFRKLFGDERREYGEALRLHYARGAPSDWRNRFVSAYASAHPWEDWAETWAHYLHLVDTLETAHAFGLRTEPRVTRGSEFAATIPFDPYDVGRLDQLIEAWLPLTFAVNSLNRSMGQPDLYPFTLAPSVIEKLAFVHGCIHGLDGAEHLPIRSDAILRAIIAGLRSWTAAPD